MNEKLNYPLTFSSWDHKEILEIQKVIKSGQFTYASEVKNFEKKYAQFFKMKHAIMVNSGSSANLVSIASLFFKKKRPLKKGDEVIVPAISWSTTYSPLQQYGLKLKFVDVDFDTLNIDTEKLKKAISKKTKLIVLVSILGNPCNIYEIAKICKDRKIFLMEDNCESLGAKYKNKYTGTSGDINTMSFFYSHHISAIEGGMVTTNNDELADLDLKEVVIRRAPGTVDLTTSNFIAADPFHTEAAGGARFTVNIDVFGSFTYLVRTRDTSGNFSEDVTGITITTVRPARNTVINAYNEDAPSSTFAGITNTNATEENFPSFATSNNGGINTASVPSSLVDNANGTSSGWSAVAAAPTDILADESATYITQIRDLGSVVTGALFVDIEATQAVETSYNDYHTVLFSGATEVSTGPVANVMQEDNFGGLGTVLGGNTASPNTTLSISYDSVNETLVDTTTSQNVYAIWNPGQFTGNVISISAIAKGTTARVTTTGSEHGIASTGSPGTRVILHDIGGMTDLEGLQVFAKRINATTVDLFTNSGLSANLNSTNFNTYTSGGVIDQGDYSNANSYALIAGVINANHIGLGASYHANGDATGGNAFANITGVASTYQLVNLQQFSDLGGAATFEGTLGAISSQTLVRTSSVGPDVLYYTGAGVSNGNVNVSAFSASGTNEGYLPHQTGTKTFRFFQIKFIIIYLPF